MVETINDILLLTIGSIVAILSAYLTNYWTQKRFEQQRKDEVLKGFISDRQKSLVNLQTLMTKCWNKIHYYFATSPKTEQEYQTELKSYVNEFELKIQANSIFCPENLLNQLNNARKEFVQASFAIWLSLPVGVLTQMGVNPASYSANVRNINFHNLDDSFNNAKNEIRNTLGIAQLEKEFKRIVNQEELGAVTNSSPKKPNLNYQNFINILYAVVIGETIFEYANDLLSFSNSALALLCIYAGIITSWFFWNKAISKYPHEKQWRFLVDIAVLIIYIVMMKNHSQPDYVFIGYVFLYMLFVVWDLLTRIRYGKKTSRLKTSFMNLLCVFSILAIRQVIFYFFTLISESTVNTLALTTLIVIVLTTQILDIRRI